ncbi:probable inactive receptor kinase At4g23740 [Magnolia sinica]|uniref:probable inactive receptor kinase At4g23740 n=1 Tax=Magnolia sinica TaxID=86752 RepID=UPI002658C264|nr:probable inactive receptor kinase At4g23740 [Magnolia sinica]XP_058096056.1 probable inactive receptor kinase At4g23740 [Magnolia sinica]
MEASFIFSAIFLLLSLSSRLLADPVEDKQALLDFIVNLPHGRNLNWNENSLVCHNWTGVTCSPDNSRVVAVRLPGVGLNGRIPPNTLGRLSALQILSLRSNGLTGPFPSDLSRIKTLTLLYLQFNNFSGPLPLDFSVWKNLTIVNLSFNSFNGSIPSSISNLTMLTSLSFANNLLSGEIPDFNLPNLQQLDLANNSLTGSVPKSLKRFPNSSFAGNNNLSLVIPPVSLSPTNPPVSTPLPSPRKTRKLGESAILGIIVGGCAVAFLACAVLLIVCCSKRKYEKGASGKLRKGERSPEKVVASSQDENNRLVFFEGCSYAFDLEDLLRASAEVLGKGTFGTAYKAVLEDATTVVVKRLKEVGVGKREFEQQMEIVGRIRHENVVELRAYYYSKDEKLMVYDYYTLGSVSSLLHGKRREDRIPLDWDTRLRIALGTARGVAYIHAENSGKLVHGNIKSSNIFLNSRQYGCVSDLGLTTLMNPAAPLSRAIGYRAPEVVDTRKASQASDVYSVGVLLLELLTGKSPVQTSAGEEVMHLVRWVQSVVREEWTAEVFDVELMRYPNIEEELVEMLQIAMACVVRMPEQRPKMANIVKMIEDVRRVDTGNRPSSEAKSDESSGQTPRVRAGESSTRPKNRPSSEVKSDVSSGQTPPVLAGESSSPQ